MSTSQYQRLYERGDSTGLVTGPSSIPHDQIVPGCNGTGHGYQRLYGRGDSTDSVTGEEEIQY
eukprot:9869-Hanusia_phi.AAC.1